jgi:putative ATPase
MKELGYHKGYKYAHDYRTGYVAQQYLPDEIAGRKFYDPAGQGYEKTIRERMEWLKSGPAPPPSDPEEGRKK